MIDLDEIESRINEGILRRHVGAQDDAFSALAVLLAEVKRLRGEADRERAAVVAWLYRDGCEASAERIERGEHRRGAGECGTGRVR